MAKLKAIVTRRWPEEVERKLGELFDVQLNKDDRPMSVAELQEALRTADVVMPTVSDRITAEVLSAEPMRCKILGNFGVGFNHIDIKAARERGVAVTNTPAVLTDCTADIAMTLMLMAARRAGEGERHVRTKAWTGWRPTHMMATKVTGKTLGLLGIGRIGKAMAKRAHHGFDMPVLFHDPYPPSAEEQKALGATRCDSIEEVLAKSDFVSLHCPATPETRHLMNAERFKQMKRVGHPHQHGARRRGRREGADPGAEGRHHRRRRARRLRVRAEGLGGAADAGERRAAAASRQRLARDAGGHGDAGDRQRHGLLRGQGAGGQGGVIGQVA